MAEMAQKEEPIFRDIRRYKCEYCGISRSKKSLLTSHLLSQHQEEMKEKKAAEDEEDDPKSHTCKECGKTFSKPAHLKQHMRPFACTRPGCHKKYRREDHLTRHLAQHELQEKYLSQHEHQKKYFECPFENCNRRFSFQDNVGRHVKMHHKDNGDINAQKEFVCREAGCGKSFKYASKLRKHEESHVKMDSVEAFCSEPGCMKPFTNEQCLRAHIRSCHQHIICEICNTKQLKKNIKRHLLIHETHHSTVKIKCSEEGCLHTFSTKSNMNQHVKAVHRKEKPYECSIPGCGERFTFKHVRDKHEKSGCHVHTPGDFVESDEQFRSRPRGGCKRKCPPVEALMRKRIVPPNQSDSVLNESSEYLSWMNSIGADDQPQGSSTQ